MDVTVADGRFLVGIFASERFKIAWKKDNTLEVSSAKGGSDYLTVTTYRGTFIEAVDESGAVILEGGDGNWCYVPVSKKSLILRIKKLPKPQLSKADISKARQRVTRYLVSDKPYNLSLPNTLAGVIKWMETKLKEIPEPSRKKASFRFDTTMEYGETYPEIEIRYEEPETDAEVIERLQIATERERLGPARIARN